MELIRLCLSFVAEFTLRFPFRSVKTTHIPSMHFMVPGNKHLAMVSTHKYRHACERHWLCNPLLQGCAITFFSLRHQHSNWKQTWTAPSGVRGHLFTPSLRHARFRVVAHIPKFSAASFNPLPNCVLSTSSVSLRPIPPSARFTRLRNAFRSLKGMSGPSLSPLLVVVATGAVAAAVATGSLLASLIASDPVSEPLADVCRQKKLYLVTWKRKTRQNNAVCMYFKHMN